MGANALTRSPRGPPLWRAPPVPRKLKEGHVTSQSARGQGGMHAAVHGVDCSQSGTCDEQRDVRNQDHSAR